MKSSHKRSVEWRRETAKMLVYAKSGAALASQLSTGMKNKILEACAAELQKEKEKILSANRKDVRLAQKAGLPLAMIDRLTLDEKRIETMAAGIQTVASLPDPIGRIESEWTRPNGLRISKVRVPLGVILIIYESRPNVTVECASLCIKSGNAVILRGGKEAFHSNKVLAGVFIRVLKTHGLERGCVNFVSTTDRQAIDFLLKQEESIQLVIPRGGEALIRKVARLSRIPVVKHYQGICHVYVDERADLSKAAAIAFNAKMQRPGVCNAMETLLVHRNVAAQFLPSLGKSLKAAGCEIRADKEAMRYLSGAKPAKAADFGHEYLDKILAVKVVDGLESAIKHIANYGSAHTDAIVTEDPAAAEIFKQRVDSSSVMVNASTRFSDGFEYGFGAEIGISTDKIHARGPMGLDGLTSYKYIVEGDGQTRQ